MDFRKLTQSKLFIPMVVVVLGGAIIIGKNLLKSDSMAQVTPDSTNTPPILMVKNNADSDLTKNVVAVKVSPKKADLNSTDEDELAIQEQLDQDRESQKETKYLKTKLEQTNLELEQEKALAEINKLKIDNMGAFKDPSEDSHKDFPEIIVEYIGGDSAKKEAILSIGGTNYQVKERSTPTDNIQVLAISDSSVTLHFSAPQNITKTIDYKPE